MPLIDRFRSFFRGGTFSSHNKRPLPTIIEYDVNPYEYWDVLGELGDGAFGKVEKVVNKLDLTKLAAFKSIEIKDDENLEDFLIEIEILTQCKHENIVKLLACYFYDEKLSIMLEFCAGGAVDCIMIDLEKPLTEPQIAYVTRNVCQALEYLHARSIIHRDLKAGNILLTSEATVKLADFGVSAKMKDKNERRDSFIGTPYWMAPEVMICETFKDQPYNCLADIWSLGITLIEMAQMDPPNYQISPMRVVIKVQKSDPPKLNRPSKWSLYFNDFIAKCLVKNPNDRCTAAELLSHPFIKDALNKKPVVQLLCEKNADIQEEIIVDEESSTCGSVADSEDRYFDFELQSMQKSDQNEAAITTNGTESTKNENKNITNKVQQQKSTLNDRLDVKIDKNKQQMFSTENDLLPKKKVTAPKPPVYPGSKSPVKQEKYFGQSQNSDLFNNESSVSSPLTSLIIQDSSENNFLNSKHPSSDSTNALSPLGQEAIDILDDLYNTLDDQSKMDQKPSSLVQSSKSLEAINNKWINETSSNTTNKLTKSPSIHNTSNVTNESFVSADSFRKTSSGSAPQTMVTTSPTKNLASVSSKESIREILKRYNSSHENISTNIDRRNRSPLKYSTPVPFQNSTRSASAHQFRSNLNKAENLSKNSNRYNFNGNDKNSPVMISKYEYLIKNYSNSNISRTSTQTNNSDKNINLIHSSNPSMSLNSSNNDLKQQGRPLSVPLQNIVVEKQLLFSSNRQKVESQKSIENKIPLAYKSPSKTEILNYNRSAMSSIQSGPINESIPPPEPPVDYDESPDIQLFKEYKLAPKYSQHLQKSQETCSFDSSYPSVENNSLNIIYNNYLNNQKQTKLSTCKLPVSGNNLLTNVQSNAYQMSRNSPQRATVTKKTRTYMVDGVEVTSTTLHVLGFKQDYELRKKEMRDLKRMQREEARQQQELNFKAEQLREQQERKFTTEKQSVHKTYENEIEMISKIQKKKLEELERMQEEELKILLKKIRYNQDRDFRLFREHLKQEQKTLKHEVDLLPKSQRKDIYRCRKESLDKSQFEREADFSIQLERNQELYLNRLREKNREKMLEIEREFLKQKHSLERSLESALWELEERQLSEKHNLITQQFRDVFHLQRTHMLARHHKELEHIRKVNQTNEENVLRALTIDRKGLPKALRNESKTRGIMFKESLRINLPGESLDKWSKQIQEFEEKEKNRIKIKMEEYDIKCKRRLSDLIASNQKIVKELEEIHNEKRNMLVDNERGKLAEYESEYRQIIEEWKTGLSARKSALEAKFADELKTQERFYNIEISLEGGNGNGGNILKYTS